MIYFSSISRIDSHFIIKITDFGLSEDICLKNYYREGTDGEKVKLPVKWMAPESLSDGHFSEKSDVVCVLTGVNTKILNDVGMAAAMPRNKDCICMYVAS